MSSTVAQEMVSQMQKISTALDELRKSGLPMSIIMAYLQKRTKLSQHDIKLVLDALGELNKELEK